MSPRSFDGSSTVPASRNTALSGLLWREDTASGQNICFRDETPTFVLQKNGEICVQKVPDTLKSARLCCTHLFHFHKRLRVLWGKVCYEMPGDIDELLQFAAALHRGILFGHTVVTFLCENQAGTSGRINTITCDVTVHRRHSAPKTTWPLLDPRRLVLVSPATLNLQLQQQQFFFNF